MILHSNGNRAYGFAPNCLRPLALLALGAAFVLGGCGDDDPLSPEDSIPPPLRNTTVPTELVHAHAEALSTMDLDRYAALLVQPVGRSEVGFKYIPRDEDVEDFAWIPEDGWGYAVEIGIIAHMMDPDFESPETGNSVQSIEMGLTVTQERAIDGGGTEVTCNADITVLWGENDGASSDVRFLITMFPDGEGFLRIRTIAELPAFAPRILPAFAPRIESSSWGSVKNLFR